MDKISQTPNVAFGEEIKQILTEEIQDRCVDCPINGAKGANGFKLIMDAKYDRRDAEEVIEAAHAHAEFVNNRCRVGTTALRQVGCFPSSSLRCTIDRL